MTLLAGVCGREQFSWIRFDSNARRELAKGLTSVVSRMESVQAEDILIAALSREADLSTRVELDKSLSAAALGSPSMPGSTRHAAILAASTFTTPPNIFTSPALLHMVAPPLAKPVPAKGVLSQVGGHEGGSACLVVPFVAMARHMSIVDPYANPRKASGISSE